MTTRFQLDITHSSVDFSIRHLVIAKVRGRFLKFWDNATYMKQLGIAP